MGHDRDRHHRRHRRRTGRRHRRGPAPGGPRRATAVRRRTRHRGGGAIVKRTSIRLADGRELIYFDERDDTVRAEVDRRDLPPRPPASELRYDPLLDEWVAIATHRQTRTFLPAANDCPLCPS